MNVKEKHDDRNKISSSIEKTRLEKHERVAKVPDCLGKLQKDFHVIDRKISEKEQDIRAQRAKIVQYKSEVEYLKTKLKAAEKHLETAQLVMQEHQESVEKLEHQKWNIGIRKTQFDDEMASQSQQEPSSSVQKLRSDSDDDNGVPRKKATKRSYSDDSECDDGCYTRSSEKKRFWRSAKEEKPKSTPTRGPKNRMLHPKASALAHSLFYADAMQDMKSTKSAEGRLKYLKARDDILDKVNEMLADLQEPEVSWEQLHMHLRNSKRSVRERLEAAQNGGVTQAWSEAQKTIIARLTATPTFGSTNGVLDGLTIADQCGLLLSHPPISPKLDDFDVFHRIVNLESSVKRNELTQTQEFSTLHHKLDILLMEVRRLGHGQFGNDGCKSDRPVKVELVDE